LGLEANKEIANTIGNLQIGIDKIYIERNPNPRQGLDSASCSIDAICYLKNALKEMKENNLKLPIDDTLFENPIGWEKMRYYCSEFMGNQTDEPSKQIPEKCIKSAQFTGGKRPGVFQEARINTYLYSKTDKFEKLINSKDEEPSKSGLSTL
jgi:hypothetical protein